jgi:hypothetical protein
VGMATDRSYWPRTLHNIDRGQNRMADSIGMDSRMGARGETQPGEARREAEQPRAEVPDWLARQLFKIFV